MQITVHIQNMTTKYTMESRARSRTLMKGSISSLNKFCPTATHVGFIPRYVTNLCIVITIMAACVVFSQSHRTVEHKENTFSYREGDPTWCKQILFARSDQQARKSYQNSQNISAAICGAPNMSQSAAVGLASTIKLSRSIDAARGFLPISKECRLYILTTQGIAMAAISPKRRASVPAQMPDGQEPSLPANNHPRIIFIRLLFSSCKVVNDS